jgi:hypothetical protein
MKIGIIGGGISGLYSAHRLEQKGHDVTIFEKNNWGGDIQTTKFDGKEYPISTLFDMSEGGELTKELNKYNIKSSINYAYGKDKFTSKHFVTFTIFLIGIIIGFTYNSKICISLMVLIIIALILIIMPVQNSIKSYIYNRTIKPVELSFGACKVCENDKNFNPTELKLNNIFDDIQVLVKLLTNQFYFPENCGFMKLVKIYLKNKNIIYINSGVDFIDRDHKSVFVGNGNYQFDKIIVACNYESYKDLISLYKNEKEVLSNARTFKFYSSIVKINNETDDNQHINKYNDILGYFELDKNINLYATHAPLIIKNNITYKTFEWDMPIIENIAVKQKINNINKNIIFIGKELAGSGVNLCIDYAKEIVDTYF